MVLNLEYITLHYIICSTETLIVNIICIHGNFRNIHIRGIFVVAFIGADYSRCL